MSVIFSSSRGPVGKAAMVVLLLALALPVATTAADARAGGGSSFGSRGARTYSAPPATSTAPRTAQPMQRSDMPNAGVAAQPRRFGLGTGLLAGLLGAGLVGSLFGGGFFGGIASLFGLVIKLALILGVVYLVVRLVRGRSAGPALAGGPRGFARTALDGGLPGGAAMPAGAGPRGIPASVGPQDYQAFEQTLGAVQEAFSREDVSALDRLGTPEIVREFGAELEANRRRGLRNDVSRVRLLQGDLSEAWSEGGATYATVAMRFAAIDVMVDRTSGRLASGDGVNPVEAVELWTFRRDGGPWRLAAIQQAA